MTFHHICNVNFERELQRNKPDSFGTKLEHSFREIERPFLSLPKLYANAGDTIFPEKPAANQIVNYWAPSRWVQAYAKKLGLIYEAPDFEVVRELTSKQKVHEIDPMPGAKILYQEPRAKEEGFVYKSFYGLAGVSHKFYPRNLRFPVVAEPWVKREFDFSTIWEKTRDGRVIYLGATILHVSARGKYQTNRVARDEVALFGKYYPKLEQQKGFCEQFLQTQKKFFGIIGFDAFIYDGILRLCCDINARKTMGFVALKLLQKQNKNELLFDYGNFIDQGRTPSQRAS